jgi:1-acyl-sn-glycerol-3-phosphate acyltransferase
MQMSSRFIAAIVRNGVFIVMKLLYRVTIINKKMSRFKGPAILYINHKRATDVFLLGGVYVPFVHWVAKHTLFRFPPFAWVLRACGAIPIKRGHHDKEAVKKVIQIVRDNGVVAIFPEGTRIRTQITDRSKVKISRSPVVIAEMTGAPIIPIAVRGDYRLFRKMYLIFGEPIHIPKKEDGSEYTSAETLAISRSIMYRIYDAADAPEAGEMK